jgi:hypothetical protein
MRSYGMANAVLTADNEGRLCDVGPELLTKTSETLQNTSFLPSRSSEMVWKVVV